MTRVHIETLDPATATLTLSLDVGLYPRDVLYAAAYVFLDRAYVLLDRQDSRFIVQFRGKRALEEATFRAMAGEFENELLAQALRHQVFDANQRIIEDVVAVAIAGASAGVEPHVGSDAEHPPLIDPGDPADGFVADAAGIGRPWEPEKQGTE
ncbi:MAG: His-Xaa-Ser system protein HxsD [Candidatus Binatia bacterium]